MVQNIPVISIAGMALTAVISIALPIIAAVWFYKKTKCNLLCVLIGAVTFVVSALVLESLLHGLVFYFVGEKLTGNIWLYALYGGLAAGLFEETGRYISMKLFMKNSLKKVNSIAYGIGHGGAESLIVVGLTYISNIVISVFINLGMSDTLFGNVPDPMKEQVLTQLSPLWTSPSNQFFLAGIERISAFVIQICLSYIVYRAVWYIKPALYFIAVAIHFFVDAGAVVLMKYISAYFVEAFLLAAAAALAVIIFRIYKSEQEINENSEKDFPVITEPDISADENA